MKLLGYFIILIFSLSVLSQADPNRPNVVLIYADDLGAGLLGHQGQEIIKTPNIDQLAKSGMSFTRAYGCTYCAPARASLLTGIHSARRNAWKITPAGAIIKKDQGLITEEQLQKALKSGRPAKKDELFLAEIFKKQGYKTAQYGKLDWGFLTSHERLKRHGWDEYLGYLDHQRAHGFYPTYLWHNGKKLPLKGNTHHDAGKTKETYGPAATAKRRDRTGKKIYSQNVFMKHMIQFIRDNKNQPFFIYHPTQLPHGPVDIPEVHPDYINDSRLTDIEKEYASMVKMLDDNVGQIITELKKQKIYDNTIVIFTSDNGHEIYYWKRSDKGKARSRNYHGEGDVFNGSNGLAGAKWTNWEGGITTPMIVTWPNHIKPNSKSERLIAAYDLMPTFAQLVGQTPPLGKDGKSFLPTLLGKAQQDREAVFVENAVISGHWKLVNHKKKTYLFHLVKDPGERHNVAEKHPEIAAKLLAMLKKERSR